MGKYVKIAACLGVLFALPVAASAATINFAVVDANGALVNNASVGFNGTKGLSSASGLWTSSVPSGKMSLIVDHPAMGSQRVEVNVDAADMFVVARVANGTVAISVVNESSWPGATIASLGLTGEAVRLPGPTNVNGFTSPAVILPPFSPTAGGGCGSILVTQSTDPNTVDAVASVSCNAGGVNVDNYYARSFNMAVENPGAPALLKCLDLGVETNVLDYNITVNIYHDPTGGDPDDGPSAVDHCGANNWILLDSSVVFVPDGTSLGFVTANYGAGIALPADATIIVEVFTPDRQTTDNGSFFLGANGAGQSASSWLASATCGLNCYLTTDAIGFAGAQWVMRLDLDPAGPVFGACCDDATGTCADGVELADCAGRFGGDGSTCGGLDPACGAIGACCMPDGSCTDAQFATDCAAAGGTYQGDVTDCAGVSCPQPPDGACCASGGACTIANEFTCAGNFQGAGSVCTPNPCPQNFVCTSGVGGQLPDQAGHGAAGTVGATSDGNAAAGFAVADNFTAIADGTVNSVCWWGIYIDFGGPTDCGPGTGDAFTITYFADDAGGTVPGSVLAGPFATTVQGTPTGLVVPTGIGDVVEYGYEATHSPVSVTAGTCYWIQIQNNTTASCFWLWSTGPAGDNRGAQDNAGWAATDYDMSYALDIDFDTSGCSIPDPCAGGTGDCCAPTGGPACGDPACCGPVCAQDAYCCDTEWDSTCVGIAETIAACGCATPENDDCATAVAVTVPSLTAGFTLGGTIDAVGDCGTTTTAPGVWYSVTGTGNFMTATTCENQAPAGSADYDTKISVFCQDCAAPTCVDGNDDESGCDFHSTIGWCSQAGAEYYIMVHGFSDNTGSFELSVFDDGVACTGGVECAPPVPTGACCHGDATCTIETEEDCTTAGSSWLGEGAECFNLAGTPTTYSSAPGVAIPDVDPIGTSDTINVGDSYAIGDVDLGLVISHTWAGDICAIVEHGGTTVTVVQRIGDTGGLVCDAAGCCGLNADNLDVVLDDEATAPINDAADPITGSYTPEQALNAFDGAEVNGDWTITVVDNASGDTGTLDSWSLIIDSGETACAECGNDIVEAGEDCDGGDCCNVDCTFATGECRAAAGDCDVAESCTGTSADCPADAFASTSTMCRPAAGDCDVADNCDGNGACGPDAKSSDVCRASLGSCDPGEACDGMGDHCPADVVIVDCSGVDLDGCCAPGCNANDDADCQPVCGNGVQEDGEECDDGNADETDSCTSTCESRQPVPAVSQWGLVILALLLLAAAKVYFSRREAQA